jgi:hypothetical protein
MHALRALVPVFAVAMTLTPADNPPAASADDPRAAQFDFWLGDWDVSSDGKPAATNTITREYDGAVIVERFVGTAETNLDGMSVSVFNRNTGKWHQTWVDDKGGYLDFVGEFKDGKMILTRRTTLQGKDVVQRMVWFNIAPDSFDWTWERSDDDGATWTTVWPLRYQRR